MVNTYLLRSARSYDIESIMHIENESFPSGIREQQDVFLDRITTYPEGNFVFYTHNEDAPMSCGHTIGYFCSELWSDIPPLTANTFSLDHFASSRHDSTGNTLYISSFAILPDYRGGTGSVCFSKAIDSILSQTHSISTILFIVNETWKAARALYNRMGFRQIEVLSSFFPAIFPETHNTAALVMVKNV